VRNSLYCRTCLRFIEWGAEAGHDHKLIWMDEPCDWCRERMAEDRAEVERLERMWAARKCAAPDCSVVFVPAQSKQRFHSDSCRKRAHRRRKAKLA